MLCALLAVSSAYGATKPVETFLFVDGPISIGSNLTEVAQMTVPSGSQLIQITVQLEGLGQVSCQVLKSNGVNVIPNVSVWTNIAGTGNGAEMVLQGKGNFGADAESD